MQTEENKPQNFFQSNTAKMLMIGLLTLALLIPLAFVNELIRERSERKNEVVNEVTETWGKDILFYGPILKIPYKSYAETSFTNPVTKQIEIQRSATVLYAYFFPELLKNSSNIKKEIPLKRGLYNYVAFSAAMKFEGNFAAPDFKKLQVNEEDILWDKASIVIRTTNLKSIKSDLKINLNSQPFVFESKNQSDKMYGELETNVFDYATLAANSNLDFNFSILYNGSNSVKFIPIGKSTVTSIDSDWKSPSFEGSFAVEGATKKVSDQGFHADWKIFQINRPFSQQHLNTIPNLDGFSYGVKLIETVDEYQQNERVSKYGFLVIGLTFLVFFLIQTISKIKIHIFQYTMIGLALIMFYTLLISITEHSSFQIAYLISSISVIAMIVIYSVSILKNKKFPLFIGISLTALYAFIYVIIQLENYALLVGSIGLFLILGAVMYFSRKIDWGAN